jgi:hypothetical protein
VPELEGGRESLRARLSRNSRALEIVARKGRKLEEHGAEPFFETGRIRTR